MATVKLGRVRPVFKGDYDPSVPYEVMDCVRRNGNLYQALRDVPVGALPEAPNSIYWMLTGMKGADGLDGRDGADGAPGPQGEPGPQGIQGEQGPQGPAGADGATGPQGPAGAQGPKGDTPPLYSGVDSAAKDVAASAFAVKTAYDKVVDVAKPRYAVCSTAAGTAEKTITLENFELVTGADLLVHFTVTNTAANPTLNVNNTGAKPIRYKAKAISAGSLTAGSTHAFVCAGGSYELVGDLDTNTTYAVFTKATASAAGKAGLVPAPDAGKQNDFLRGDGTWASTVKVTDDWSSGSPASAGIALSPAGVANAIIAAGGEISAANAPTAADGFAISPAGTNDMIAAAKWSIVPNWSADGNDTLGTVLPDGSLLITKSGTFTVPATGVYSVAVVGGGGRGGNSYRPSDTGTPLNSGGGGGGGAGQYVGANLSLTKGTVIAVVVGGSSGTTTFSTVRGAGGGQGGDVNWNLYGGALGTSYGYGGSAGHNGVQGGGGYQPNNGDCRGGDGANSNFPISGGGGASGSNSTNGSGNTTYGGAGGTGWGAGGGGGAGSNQGGRNVTGGAGSQGAIHVMRIA